MNDQTRDQLLEELRERLAAAAAVVARYQKQEEELKRQKEILQTIFDHIPVMIRFVDPTGRYQLVNTHWERVLGWSKEDIGHVDFVAECYPDPADRQRVVDFIRQASAGWTDFRTRVRDGRVLDTRWANVQLSDGSTLGFGLDITEREQAERAQEKAAARLQALSRRLVEVQEEDRRHLARELHDEIGQSLTCLRFTLERCAAQAPEAVRSALREAEVQIQELLQRVRGLSFDLRPALLDHFGLSPALDWLIERFASRTGVRVNCKSTGLESRLPPATETAAYRVVQEALTNVARHAGVAEVAVRVWVEADTLEVQVEDEGAGFDAEAVLAAGHSSGLPGMMERVAVLGGRLAIDSAPGCGTHLLAQIPLHLPTRKKIDEHFLRLGRCGEW